MGFKKDAAEKSLEVATDLVKDNATNLLGMLFPYSGLKKKAVEMRMEQIEKSNLPEETKIALLLNMKKEFKRLKNQKAVAEIAFNEAKEGTDFSEKSGVNDEWFERFMDAAKFVSSEDMQLIWGKILAGEFEKPGSTPPNMIRVLSEMTPKLAQAFRAICSMNVTYFGIKENVVNCECETIIAPYKFDIIRFDELFSSMIFNLSMYFNELDSLGVIRLESIDITYISEKYNICLMNIENKYEMCVLDKSGGLPAGNVMLTDVGKALRKITEPVKIEGYREMVKEYMIKKGVEFEDINDYIIEKDEGGVLTITKKNK